MKYRSLLLFVMLLLSVGMPALAQDEMATPDLRIGALPVLNMVPLYVAQQAGYFDEAGVVVEIVDYASGADAQAAVIAGEIDGFQADLVSALKVNAGGGDVRVVRHVGITNIPFISIVAGRDSGIESMEELAGGRIGLSLNTIIQYMTDTLLTSAGVDAGGVEYVDVPGIWNRTQRLVDGEISAATLPELYATSALQYGGKVLIDDAAVDYVPESLNIRAETLAEKGEAVRAFLAAYERAVDTINAMEGDASAYRAFLESGDGHTLTSAFSALITVAPVFSRARVPSEAEFSAVRDWALDAGLLTETQSYADVVADQFLPEVMEDEMAPADEMAEATVEPVAESGQAMREPDLRLAVRPSMTALPLHVAQAAGYFEEAGVVVELVDFITPSSQQSAIQTGEFDGLQTGSIVRLSQLNAAGYDVHIVREIEIINLPNISIITGPASGIESVEDLVDASISIIGGSAEEYSLDQLLASVGLVGQVEYVKVGAAAVGDLLDQLVQGQIKAMLGDQLITQVVMAFGGRSLLDSNDIDYVGVQEVLGFRAEVLAEKGDAVRAFLRAYARAEEALNALAGDTGDYREFAQSIGMGQDAPVTTVVFSGLAPVPIFAAAAMPSEEDINPILEWAVAFGRLEEAPAYEDLVDDRFLMEVMAEE